jgi:hypothetical protein
MAQPTSGRIGRISCCPTVNAWIVPTTCIQIARTVVSTPDNHFVTSPYCGVRATGSGDISLTCGCPNAGDRIVPPAGVQMDGGPVSAPDDHLSAGPDCAV